MYQVLVDLHMHQTAVCIKLNIQTKHKYYTILVEIDTLVEIDALVVYSTICGPAYILYVCPASMTIRLFHIPGFQVIIVWEMGDSNPTHKQYAVVQSSTR